jgi:hypothetical protein
MYIIFCVYSCFPWATMAPVLAVMLLLLLQLMVK